jgi:chromosome partitioning protein
MVESNQTFSVRQKSMALEAGQQARVLAIVNRKGGVAKTTTAVNLAHGLSRKLIRRVASDDLDQVPDESQLFQFGDQVYLITGHVLLVDLDPQGHCAPALGIEPAGGDVGEVLLGRQQLNQAVVSADRSADGYPRPNLWLLPASDNLEWAKEALHSQALEYFIAGYDSKEAWMLALLERRLKLARDRFTFIIFDCAPGLDVFSRAVQQFSGAAIVPVKPDFLSMAGTGQNLKRYRDLQLRGINVRIHTILPTFCMARQRLDREMMAELRRNYGDLVTEPVPRSQLAAEAPAQQLTLFEVDPKYANPATVAYQNLVDRVYYG